MTAPETPEDPRVSPEQVAEGRLIRKAIVAFPIAFGIMVIGSVILVASLADAGKEPKLKFLVKHGEAPTHLISDGKASAKLLVGPMTGADELSMQELLATPGTKIPTHVHENSAEFVHIIEGRVLTVIKGRQYEARAGDTLYIPAGVKHNMEVIGRLQPVRAIQVYVGPGPEERFRQGDPIVGE